MKAGACLRVLPLLARIVTAMAAAGGATGAVTAQTTRLTGGGSGEKDPLLSVDVPQLDLRAPAAKETTTTDKAAVKTTTTPKKPTTTTPAAKKTTTTPAKTTTDAKSTATPETTSSKKSAASKAVSSTPAALSSDPPTTTSSSSTTSTTISQTTSSSTGTTAAATPTTTPSSGHDSLSKGAVAGIAVGSTAVVFGGLAGLVGYMMWRAKKSRDERQGAVFGVGSSSWQELGSGGGGGGRIDSFPRGGGPPFSRAGSAAFPPGTAAGSGGVSMSETMGGAMPLQNVAPMQAHPPSPMVGGVPWETPRAVGMQNTPDNGSLYGGGSMRAGSLYATSMHNGSIYDGTPNASGSFVADNNVHTATAVVVSPLSPQSNQRVPVLVPVSAFAAAPGQGPKPRLEELPGSHTQAVELPA